MVSPEVGIREGIRDKDSGVVGRRAGGEVVLASKRARRAKFKYSFPQQSASVLPLPSRYFPASLTSTLSSSSGFPLGALCVLIPRLAKEQKSDGAGWS